MASGWLDYRYVTYAVPLDNSGDEYHRLGLMARATGWMILALLRLAVRLALTIWLFSKLSLVSSISWQHVR